MKELRSNELYTHTPGLHMGGMMPTRDIDNRSLWNDGPDMYLDFSGSGYVNLMSHRRVK